MKKTFDRDASTLLGLEVPHMPCRAARFVDLHADIAVPSPLLAPGAALPDRRAVGKQGEVRGYGAGVVL